MLWISTGPGHLHTQPAGGGSHLDPTAAGTVHGVPPNVILTKVPSRVSPVAVAVLIHAHLDFGGSPGG